MIIHVVNLKQHHLMCIILDLNHLEMQNISLPLKQSPYHPDRERYQAEVIVLAMLQACMYLIQVKVDTVKNKKERLIILSFLYKPKIFSLSMI